MSTLLPKSQMTEEDIKLNFITAALLNRGWQNKITMETSDGNIYLENPRECGLPPYEEL